MAARQPRLTTAEVCALFDGIDERTVRNWVAAGCPHLKEGRHIRFVAAKVIAWRRKQDVIDARNETAPDEAAERARKLRADADLAELKVRERRGELVSTADAIAAQERLCSLVRSRVLGVRGRWAPRILGLSTMPEAVRILDALAHDILAALVEGADELEQDALTAAAA